MNKWVIRSAIRCIGFLLWGGSIQTSAAWLEREKIDFAYVEAIARERADYPFETPRETHPVPESLQRIDYSGYHRIRFDGPKALWTQENLPFRLMPMHPGYLFLDTIKLHECTDTFIQPLRFNASWYRYENPAFDPKSLPDTLGFGGLQLSYQLNHHEHFNEFAVFQGASYYRMLGKDQTYGLSARGLAIDTMSPGRLEEFPLFTQHWLVKPNPGDEQIVVYSLLESRSVTGAYRFVIIPGVSTVAEVTACLFFRDEPGSIGMAPMSSMFWFGDGSRAQFDDFRPEVHDSDGLVMRSSSGECIWRPLQNSPGNIHVNSFFFDQSVAFGLVQRDRDYHHYHDPEARYHLRPGLWVEPMNDWGPGTVRLLELPTHDETDDNIVVLWEPANPPSKGEPYRFSYRQHWTSDGNPANAAAWVVSTRTGVLPWIPGKRLIVLEWDGDPLREMGADSKLEAIVTVQNPEELVVSAITVHRNPVNNLWRVTFLVEPGDDNMDPSFRTEIDQVAARIALGQKMGVVPPRMKRAVELRCYLKSGEDILSETWSWRMDP